MLSKFHTLVALLALALVLAVLLVLTDHQVPDVLQGVIYGGLAAVGIGGGSRFNARRRARRGRA